MPTGRFQKGPNYRTPFGHYPFLGSTEFQVESWTVACATVPNETIDGFTQKVLRPGTLMAKITGTGGGGAAADVGKVGPFDTGAGDGRQTKANLVGCNNTFLPWTALERDADIGIVYDAWVIAAGVVGYEAGVLKTLTQLVTDTILAYGDLVLAGNPGLELRVRKASTNPGGGEFDTWPV